MIIRGLSLGSFYFERKWWSIKVLILDIFSVEYSDDTERTGFEKVYFGSVW